jgi:hypothetical protein
MSYRDRVQVRKNDPGVREIINAAFPGWKGRKVHIEPDTSHRVWDFWDGGSRDYTRFVELSTMRSVSSDAIPREALQKEANPYGLAITKDELPIPPGIAVVIHSIFCGKEGGITIKVHPDNLQRLLPGKAGAL